MRSLGILLMLVGFLGGPLWTACSMVIAFRAQVSQDAEAGEVLAGGVSVGMHWTFVGLFVGLVGLVLWLASKRKQARVPG